MVVSPIDWIIVFSFFAIALLVGIAVSKSAGRSEADFFLGGRSMPWWLLGFSMVATTFSTDTPNLVTDIVRKDGVAGNWVWWAFLLTGMLTVFVYAKLWRRSNVLTDVEFYEIRYSGKSAAFLRGFRAIYLGFFFNVMIMAGVTLAAIKIGGVMLGLSPLQTILLASVVTVIFSAMGGFKGVLITDFLLFIMAMVGAIGAAYFALGHESVGGLNNMITHFKNTPDLKDKLSILPALSNKDAFIAVFLVPIAVQWWSVWYPGAEPGGGGYLVQRMLAAKNEKHSLGATLFFNAAHYALRPWPWIIVALCSLMIFPMNPPAERESAKYALRDMDKVVKAVQENPASSTSVISEQCAALEKELAGENNADKIKADYSAELTSIAANAAKEKESAEELLEEQKTTLDFKSKGLTSIREAFPKDKVPDDKIGHDVGYSAMLTTILPTGWLGLVLASLIAAYMSTISTHLNWGSSYIVNDWYQRFLKPEASQKELVWVGRVSTVVLMVITALVALSLQNALQLFAILLQIGAGTGLLFILRWFWWRINAVSELVAMIVSFIIAVYFEYFHAKVLPDINLETWQKLCLGVGITTVCWVFTALVTKPAEDKTLRKFCKLCNPGGPGWKQVFEKAESEGDPIQPSCKADSLPLGILCMLIGCVAVYSTLFATGFWLYAERTQAIVLTAIAAVAATTLIKLWSKVNASSS